MDNEMNTIESLANAIKEIIEYQKHLANEITEIKTSIMDELINPIKDEYEKMEYDNALSDWRCKYAEKLEGFDGKLKALEGEDFDIIKKSFDDFNERTDGMEPDEYVDKLADSINEQLTAIGEAFGIEPEKIEEVKIETEDGEVKAEVEDGEVTEVEGTMEGEVTEESEEKEEAETEVEEKETEAEEPTKEEVEIQEEVERPENATDTPDNEEENYKYWEEQMKGLKK